MTDRWSIERVPIAKRWACVDCGTTIEEGTSHQPALGGYRQGTCPNTTCQSNTSALRHNHTYFAPIKEHRPSG